MCNDSKTRPCEHMPLLNSAPSTYARLVQMVLRGIPPSVALPFLDDLILHTATVKEHLTALEAVFKAYRRARLRLNPLKCFLLQSEATYLGYKVKYEQRPMKNIMSHKNTIHGKVTKDGLSPTDEYVSVVKSWPMPKTRKALRGFIGKVNHHV